MSFDPIDHQHLVDSFTLTKEASESSWGEDERGNWEWTREQMLPFFIFPSFLHFLSLQGTRFISQASVKFPPFHHQNYFLVVWISDAHISSWDVYLEKVFYFFHTWVSLLPCIHRHHNFPASWAASAQFPEQYMVSWCGLPLLTSYSAKKTHLKKHTKSTFSCQFTVFTICYIPEMTVSFFPVHNFRPYVKSLFNILLSFLSHLMSNCFPRPEKSPKQFH